MPPVILEECHEHLRNGNYHNCGIPGASLNQGIPGLRTAANPVGDLRQVPACALMPEAERRARSPIYPIHRYAAMTRRANKKPVKTKVNPTRRGGAGTIFPISLSLSVSSRASSLSAICSNRRGASPRKETRDENIRPPSWIRPTGPRCSAIQVLTIGSAVDHMLS